jgi:glycerol-3-phosphate dehydrogenase (NAD(P)+)
MQKLQRLTVLGGGSFGTAIANMAAENGYPTLQWMRNQKQADKINQTKENTRYMPGYKLDKLHQATTDFEFSLSESQLIFVSIPSKSFRQVVHEAAPFIKPDTILISTTKGIEPDGFKLMSQVLKEEVPQARVGVLSGPNLAKEIALHQLTATVIASEDEQVRNQVQVALGSSYFRVYANTDVFGVELGGALKNIYAIISGLADALGMLENTKSMLMTRSLAEMSRFAVQLGANPMTFLGLAGVGDLIVTCHSPLSRNFRVGYEIGKGKSLEDAVEELGEVAEGINTLKFVKAKAEELDIYMPLVQGLYALLFGDADIKSLVNGLMLAQQSSDVEFILPREAVNPPIKS